MCILVIIYKESENCLKGFTFFVFLYYTKFIFLHGLLLQLKLLLFVPVAKTMAPRRIKMDPKLFG